MWAAENGSAGSNTFCIQKYLETEYWSRFRQYRRRSLWCAELLVSLRLCAGGG